MSASYLAGQATAYLFIPTSESPNENHLLCEEMYIYILSPSSLHEMAP